MTQSPEITTVILVADRWLSPPVVGLFILVQCLLVFAGCLQHYLAKSLANMNAVFKFGDYEMELAVLDTSPQQRIQALKDRKKILVGSLVDIRMPPSFCPKVGGFPEDDVELTSRCHLHTPV